MKAEVLTAQSKRKEAEALLRDPVPGGAALSQMEVRRLLDLAAAGTQSDAQKAELIARARAGVKDPELSIRLNLVDGVLAINEGRTAASEELFRTAVGIATRERSLYWQAQALSNLSVSAKKLDQYEESIDFGRRALAAAEQAGARRVAAFAHGNLGSSYGYLGDFGSAFEHEQKAIQIFEAMGARSNLMIALGELGLMYDRQGDLPKALSNYRRAYDIARELGSDLDATRNAENLSLTLIKSGEWDAAARWNQRAAELAVTVHDPSMAPFVEQNWALIAHGRGRPEEAARICRELLRAHPDEPNLLWEAYALLGAIDADAGRFRAADRSFESALQIIENTRSDLLNSHFRITLLSRLIPFYQEYVDTLVQQNNDARALEVVESSRARVLAERLGRPFSPGRFAGLAAFERLARSSDSSILSFWLAQRRSFAWLITGKGVYRFQLPAAGEIEALVASYRATVEHSLRDPIAVGDPAGPALWKALLSAIAPRIPKGARLIIIPDGVLYGLNLETLVVPSPEPHYWIEDEEIAICPSITIAARRPETAGGQQNGPVLLIGAPDYAGTQYEPLQNAGSELRDIESLFRNRPQKIFTGAQASPMAYRQSQPAGFSLIHFAAHAEANHERPLESAVILSRSNGQYRLLARDVIGIPIHANLVTISACRSAGARTYAGEGLVGFAWAFLQAGAHAVAAGLWDVSDQSTERLMNQFYSGIASGQDPVHAMRAAKLALLKGSPSYRKPFYWAPFEIYLASAAR